jgi:hypothetical protein
MQIFDLIKELKDEGLLTNMVRCGLIGSKASTYFDIVEAYEEKIKRSPSSSKTMICFDVANMFKVEVTTVYRARKLMKSDLQSRANKTNDD